MGVLQLRVAQVGEGGDVFSGQLHQVVTLQRIFRGPHNALGHVPQQLFPLMQVAGGRWNRDQFAVDAARHRFAVHVADMPTEQARGTGR
ncbi:hypothetical protein D3C84_819060 [compost metagenome]